MDDFMANIDGCSKGINGMVNNVYSTVNTGAEAAGVSEYYLHIYLISGCYGGYST
jgi:hypothetical protein